MRRQTMKTLCLAPMLFLLSVTAPLYPFSWDGYDSLLARSVCNGMVNYGSLINDPALERIAAHFSSVTRSHYETFTREEKLAFLINAYNFFTLQLIVDNYPLRRGIRDIRRPWDRAFINLLGDMVSLNYIEHEVIRKEFDEPRIHFAVNCASIGCPQLLDEAFRGKRLEEQLERVTTLFLSDTTKNRFDGSDLYLSKIFEWYGDDFKENGGYETFVRTRAGVPGPGRVRFLDYDWGLNDSAECP